ncbi:MAG: type II toxin-antitoxin system RelB/DinJ family antitoxin, partial [Clostridiales bacterium]|nr:type II toxin-antitoxin system RelB/DinJ family antitoxin [Clostridiales bacterium]
MSSTIQIRVDDELKIKSDNLFRELGTDTTTAIRMFLTQAVATNGFPFEIKKVSRNPYSALSEDDMLAMLEIARSHAEQGMVKDADDVSSDL